MARPRGCCDEGTESEVEEGEYTILFSRLLSTCRRREVERKQSESRAHLHELFWHGGHPTSERQHFRGAHVVDLLQEAGSREKPREMSVLNCVKYLSLRRVALTPFGVSDNAIMPPLRNQLRIFCSCRTVSVPPCVLKMFQKKEYQVKNSSKVRSCTLYIGQKYCTR